MQSLIRSYLRTAAEDAGSSQPNDEVQNRKMSGSKSKNRYVRKFLKLQHLKHRTRFQDLYHPVAIVIEDCFSRLSTKGDRIIIVLGNQRAVSFDSSLYPHRILPVFQKIEAGIPLRRAEEFPLKGIEAR